MCHATDDQLKDDASLSSFLLLTHMTLINCSSVQGMISDIMLSRSEWKRKTMSEETLMFSVSPCFFSGHFPTFLCVCTIKKKSTWCSLLVFFNQGYSTGMQGHGSWWLLLHAVHLVPLPAGQWWPKACSQSQRDAKYLNPMKNLRQYKQSPFNLTLEQSLLSRKGKKVSRCTKQVIINPKKSYSECCFYKVLIQEG